MSLVKMKSVLLFRLGGLGDLFVAFPSISLLRKKLFSPSLTLVCRPEYGLILKETGVVDNILPVDQAKLAPLFDSLPFPRELTQWLQEFSFISGWLQKKSSLNHEELCRSGKRCRFFIPNPDYPGPISQNFYEKTLEFLAGLRGPSPSFNECIQLALNSYQKEIGLELVGKEPEEVKRGLVVIHPGSGSTSKCWPLGNFEEIISRLSLKGYRGALVTGMADEEIENTLKELSLPEKWVWLRSPPLLKLSGLLANASLYLGNDSGITHLAAACGTKVVALFRKDLEAGWKPYGQTVVLSEESVSDISPHSVWEAITRILNSRDLFA
jgi:ADP-heptose:LPS heptosyltransferase